MNPLVPSALDGVLTIGSLVALILALVALISVLRATFPSGWRQLAWALVVLVVPYIGPLAWFVARRRERSLELGHGVDGS
ncbi:Phospholipase_D-nuclease N-terminal [Curtobacterium sp. 314Chir4.1]|uniref:PLD nuclease N-terminal domain-containing protein n=1 Tax=Curtobacterium sp. 314Chir4.1 TaxID=1279028 RepID=UPI000BC47694|nr:PLD nuclease N-terminal domain-containing protein [Curtobacterium sp. 314Chir4.1]SOC88093.1 Phospholipase_D-nuclease N-terminal [Curtobacterium sp. 314Chir4.1]